MSKNKVYLPWFTGSTKRMIISKNPKSFPKSQPVIGTLESLSEGHSFLLYGTIPTNLIGRDVLCKWNYQIKCTAKGLLFKILENFSHTIKLQLIWLIIHLQCV